MRSRYIKIPVFLFLFLMTKNVSSQNLAEQLRERTEGKKNFTEIINEINQFYNEIPSDHRDKSYGGIPKLKHLKRWEWYLSGRLDENGNVANVDSLMKIAHLDHLKKFGSSSKTPALWESIGPKNSDQGIGRIDRIEFHPTNANIMYAGAPAGGLWRTNDGGTTWTNLTDNIDNPGISGIAINQSNPNIIYILTGDGDSRMGGFVEQFGYSSPSDGIYRSSDGGNSWTHWVITAAPEEYSGYALILHPTNDGELYVATSKGLYHRFQDVFGTWIWELEIDGHFWDVEFKPNNPNTVYAAGKAALFASTVWRTLNEGGTWGTSSFDPLAGGPCFSPGRIQLAVTPDNSSAVYALMGPVTSSGNFCGLFKSTDDANSFTRMTTTPNILGFAADGQDDNDQSTYDLAIAANPNDEDEIYTGGITIWQSTDGGSDNTFLNTSYHVDIHDLKYNPVNGNIFAATDGGVYRSTDNGSNWTDLSDGLHVSQIYRMSGGINNHHDLYVGLQDNGIFTREGDTDQFELRWTGDGFASAEVVGTLSFKRFFSTANRRVARISKDSIGNWFVSSDITPPGTEDMWFKNIATHNSDNNIVVLGSQDIWRSTNANVGFTSNIIWTNVGASGSWSITNCKSNDDRFYATGGDSYINGEGSIYRSDDAGLTWNDIKNTGFPENFTKITQVNAAPSFSDYVCASFGGFTSGVKVARSINAGQSWVNISYNLPNVPVNCVVIDDGFNVYIGTDTGVYRLANGETSWTYVSTSIPHVPITDIIVDDKNAWIYASTFGRGVYRSEIFDIDCLANQNIVDELKGVHNIEAANDILAESYIDQNATVQFKAGNAVILKPGFRTYPSTNLFRAYTGGCQDEFKSADN